MLLLCYAIFHRTKKKKIEKKINNNHIESSEEYIEPTDSLVEKLDTISKLDSEVDNLEKTHKEKLNRIDEIRKNSISIKITLYC